MPVRVEQQVLRGRVTLARWSRARGVVDSARTSTTPLRKNSCPRLSSICPATVPMRCSSPRASGDQGAVTCPRRAALSARCTRRPTWCATAGIRLYDWGLNYNDWYPQEEVLETNNSISAEDLARYDKLSRAGRAQTVELFGQMTGVDLEAAFGEGLVSNTAYYAASQQPEGLLPWILALATGLTPP